MSIVLLRAPDLDLGATMDSGQVFGFSRDVQGAYCGVIGNRPVRFLQIKGDVHYEGCTKAIAHRYFDLDRDLTSLYRVLSDDTQLAPALANFRGLRLIRQDPWEALVGFILSSNNNVKRIQGIWKNLSEYFGGRRKIRTTAFPSAAEMARSHEKILRGLGLGYRAPFLHSTARFLSNNPDYLDHIRSAEYREARERVIAFPGIGPKVADCILLYGFQKYEAFPVDVWIRRVMKKLYFKNRNVSEDKIRAFAAKKWGSQAGYVQQYLFHGGRMGVL